MSAGGALLRAPRSAVAHGLNRSCQKPPIGAIEVIMKTWQLGSKLLGKPLA
jgi:hypothetical protein